MIEILEMRENEIGELLGRLSYAHLGCSLKDRPYVIPIYYVFDGKDIFMYTTAGLKSTIIRQNPKVCLQVEEMVPEGGWRSVVINGEAFEISDRSEREKAVELIRSVNPSLLPALAIKWSNDWMRKNVEVVYRLAIESMTGRFTSEIQIAAAGAKPILCGTRKL